VLFVTLYKFTKVTPTSSVAKQLRHYNMTHNYTTTTTTTTTTITINDMEL